MFQEGSTDKLRHTCRYSYGTFPKYSAKALQRKRHPIAKFPYVAPKQLLELRRVRRQIHPYVPLLTVRTKDQPHFENLCRREVPRRPPSKYQRKPFHLISLHETILF